MNKRLLAGFLLLLSFNALLFAASADTRQIAWSDLPTVFHKNIRIVMPDGTRIEGKAVALETDALAVQVTKSTNGNDYPKGRLLVPRATLRAFEIPNPTYHWRILGAVGGLVAGVAAMIGLSFATNNSAAWFGGAAIPVVGYFLGWRADQRVTTYVLTQ